MDRGWIRRSIGLLALFVALALPLIAYADRRERIEPVSKREIMEVEPKRTVLTFEETRIEAERALPKLEYSTLFERPSFPRSRGTLVRVRQNFDDKPVDSVLSLGSG